MSYAYTSKTRFITAHCMMYVRGLDSEYNVGHKDEHTPIKHLHNCVHCLYTMCYFNGVAIICEKKLRSYNKQPKITNLWVT